jgi:hypothetical protein
MGIQLEVQKWKINQGCERSIICLDVSAAG